MSKILFDFFTGKDLLKVGSTGDFLIQPNNIFTEQEKMCA